MYCIDSRFILITDDTVKKPPRYAYQLAGRVVLSVNRIALINQFSIPVASLDTSMLDAADQRWSAIDNEKSYEHLIEGDCLYDGDGSFSGGVKRVAMHKTGQYLAFKVDGCLQALIDSDNLHIHCVDKQGTDNAYNAEILLGAPLLFLLATMETFCLHAGAVKTPSGVAVFIGESGRGKSTLSRSSSALSWDTLADDILPVCLSDGMAYIQARFPQFKTDIQSLDYEPLAIAGIFQLAEATHNVTEIDIQRKDGCSSLLALTRHTAASRVFSSDLLSSHMKFCQALQQLIPVYQLSYPRQLDRLDELRSKIIQSMAEA